jgi:hypothetical protein
VGYGWNSKGPQWFKSEEMTFHHECEPKFAKNSAIDRLVSETQKNPTP